MKHREADRTNLEAKLDGLKSEVSVTVGTKFVIKSLILFTKHCLQSQKNIYI